MRDYLLFVLALFLASTFIISCAEKVEWYRPQQVYRQCLRDNPGDHQKCESERQAYQQQVEQLRGTPIDEGGAGRLQDDW